MSREDSQFKLRMPAILREHIEQAAQQSKRSLNAEIVARLEESLFRSEPTAVLLSASEARKIAAISRQRTAEELRNDVLLEIQVAITKGASTANADLKQLGLANLSESEHVEVTSPICTELKDAGYRLSWDGPDYLTIDFSEG